MSGCSGQTYLNSSFYVYGPQYELVSPGYPVSYPNNIRCEWIFTAVSLMSVGITFSRLELEEGWNCGTDYVELWGGMVFFTFYLWFSCIKMYTPNLIPYNHEQMFIPVNFLLLHVALCVQKYHGILCSNHICNLDGMFYLNVGHIFLFITLADLTVSDVA